MSKGDGIWERVKLRYPQLADFDMIRDQSQTHHTLVVGLAFGTLGALGGWSSGLGPSKGYALGIAIGVVIAYAIGREHWPIRWFGKTDAVDKWDGTMDAAVPLARLAPFAAACWLFPVPWWLLAVAVGLQAVEGLGYSFFRPAGSLFYGGRGLREDVCA